jgi:hypothetical protein
MPELISGPSYVDKTGNMPKFCDTYMFPVRPKETISNTRPPTNDTQKRSRLSRK